MPQKPFLTTGSLREQFTYPPRDDDNSNPISDGELLKLLQMVNLGYLLDRFDLEIAMDWPNILSVGEQQRIGMARVLFRQPSHAVLDECTSAVPTDIEAKFYEFLIANGTTFISVAHHETCRQYHDCALELDGKGNYTFTLIDKEEERRKIAAAAVSH